MKRSCDFASEQQEVRRRAAFDMRGISLRNVPVSRSSSVPLRGRFRVFRVCRRRNLRHQRVDWTYRGQPGGDAARCGQDNWVETDTHPCAALGARRPNGAHTQPGTRRTCAALGAGRPNGEHTRPGAGRIRAALGAGRPNGAHTRPGARRTRAALGARRPNGAHTRPGARRTCAALGAGRPNGAHTRLGARRTRAAPGAGRLNGAHTHGPARDGPPLFFSQ